jgi:L-alanine-DL-glutamate epimerase-like enolase superfamily enzyme
LKAASLVEAFLEEHPADRVASWSSVLRSALPNSPTARSAVEMAILDALTRGWGTSLWNYFGGYRKAVRTDLSISLTHPEEAEILATNAAQAGYRSLKIKVGGPDREADLERVLAVHRVAPEAGIRLDANQGFDPPDALAFVRRCQEAGVSIELLEQPVPASDWDALAAVTRECPVPVIADEAVQDVASALRVATTGAAHGINIKVAKSGLLEALQIIAVAQAGGLKLMLGCMMESLLGIGASLALAAGTGAFDYLDLDSHALIGLTPTGSPFDQHQDILIADTTSLGIGWSRSLLADSIQ